MERSLGQGLYFKNNWNTEYEQHQSRDVSMYDNIDAKPDNSAPVIEGMTNNITDTTKEVNKKMKIFQEKYKEFKKTKNEVNETRQKYLQSLKRNVILPDDVQEYLNYVVKHNEKYYYINRFGYKREFISDNNIDINTCGVPGVDHPHRSDFKSSHTFWDSGKKETTEIINKETKVPYKGDIPKNVFNKLQNGPPMFDKAPCGYEGTVIKDGTQDLFAWIDSEGVRHTFGSKEDWNENDTCPTSYDVVTTSQFNSFTIGEEMTGDDKCSTFIDNPGVRSQLISQTGKLHKITEELLTDHTELLEEDGELKDEINQTKNDFYKILDELNEQMQKDRELENQQHTLKTRWDNTVIEERQQYYLYGGGLVLTVVLGGFAFYHASRSS